MLLCNSPEIFKSWNFSVYLESLLVESSSPGCGKQPRILHGGVRKTDVRKAV